jgi:ribonuclease HI
MSPCTRRSPTRVSRLPPLCQDVEANGVATNNVSEYSALVVVVAGVRELEVRSDPELMVKQMRGEYRVKNRDLQLLFLDASRAARDVTYTHLGREHSELADCLVNEALDTAAS